MDKTTDTPPLTKEQMREKIKAAKVRLEALRQKIATGGASKEEVEQYKAAKEMLDEMTGGLFGSIAGSTADGLDKMADMARDNPVLCTMFLTVAVIGIGFLAWNAFSPRAS